MTSHTITSTVGSLVLPGRMITDQTMVWRADQVSCLVVQEELELPPELEAISEHILRIKEADNNPSFNYRHARVSRDRLGLEVGLSRYQSNLIHAALEPVMVEKHPEMRDQLFKHVGQEDLFNFEKLGGPSKQRGRYHYRGCTGRQTHRNGTSL